MERRTGLAVTATVAAVFAASIVALLTMPSKKRIKKIEDRLCNLEARMNELSKQITSFQQIISPNNASQSLTVARMREENPARIKFEEKIDGRIKGFEERVNRTEDGVDNMQFWIWGTLISIIEVLIGVAVFLGRRLSLVLNTLAIESREHIGTLGNSHDKEKA